VDYKGNVWIGGNGEKDAQILKFTKEGKFLMQVGHFGKNGGSNDQENFGRPAKIWVDPKTNEAYVADGYLNKRVAVLDADTGKMKRYCGAYGNKPDDANLGPYDPKAPPAQQFRNPVHCIERTNDGLLYVCDRQNDRLQVFQPDGTFVKEMFYAKNTLGAGSVWDITFSKDPAQRYIMLTDGQNERVRVILRDTLEELTSFGDGGRQPGEFYGVHSIASDSKGNLHTTETYEGKRVQKFIYKASARSPAAIRACPGRSIDRHDRRLAASAPAIAGAELFGCYGPGRDAGPSTLARSGAPFQTPASGTFLAS
jgi:DNA-binding beta-propeller fold protein YncE